MDNGLPVTPAASVARNLLRVADFLPFGYGFAIVSMLVRRDYKRLGDIAAATIVVHEPRAAQKVRSTTLRWSCQRGRWRLRIRRRSSRSRLARRSSRPSGSTSWPRWPRTVSGDAGRSGPDVTRRVLGVAQWVLGRQ